MKQKIAKIISLVDERFINEADPSNIKQKKKFSWKKLTAAAACICVFATALTLGILVPSLSRKSFKNGIVSKELISISENAQYLPSRELLVAKQTSKQFITPMLLEVAVPIYSGVSPKILLEGDFSEDSYEKLIEDISPIDTPYNSNFTVLDAKNEVTKILSAGVVFDEWFSYKKGNLSGTGKYYVSNKDGVLTVIRRSSFLPWIYDAASNRFLDNNDLSSDNIIIRSDYYLQIKIYTENGKEVVECEAVENLSYYGKVTPISYQFTRNVKDTSFSKIQIVNRGYIPNPEVVGGWGYDINTDSSYGYKRTFTQLDYSSPNDIKWFKATQELPYAFSLASNYIAQYGCRSEKGGFYYRNSSNLNNGRFSYTPNNEYLTLEPSGIIELLSEAQADNIDSTYNKNLSNKLECNDKEFTRQQQEFFNKQIFSMLNSLKTLAKGESLPTDIESFDCSAQNTDFEYLIYEYLNLSAKMAIDNSSLARDNLNNDLYKLDEVMILPNNYNS